jgi:hypothetical protein
MVKVVDITLECDWEEIVRNKIQDIGFTDGFHYRYYMDGEVRIYKSVPILQKTGDTWLHKTYKIGNVDGTKAGQTISVFGEQFVPTMTDLAAWLEKTFDRPTTVILKSKTKKRIEGGFIKWIQDVWELDKK